MTINCRLNSKVLLNKHFTNRDPQWTLESLYKIIFNTFKQNQHSKTDFMDNLNKDLSIYRDLFKLDMKTSLVALNRCVNGDYFDLLNVDCHKYIKPYSLHDYSCDYVDIVVLDLDPIMNDTTSLITIIAGLCENNAFGRVVRPYELSKGSSKALFSVELEKL